MSSNGSAPDAVSVEVPQFAFYIQPDDEGKPWYIGMQISTSGTEFKAFLCTPGDIVNTHRVFNRELTRIETEIRRTQRGLIMPTGGEVDAIRKAKGR
jgi:hypothetical protein